MTLGIMIFFPISFWYFSQPSTSVVIELFAVVESVDGGLVVSKHKHTDSL